MCAGSAGKRDKNEACSPPAEVSILGRLHHIYTRTERKRQLSPGLKGVEISVAMKRASQISFPTRMTFEHGQLRPCKSLVKCSQIFDPTLPSWLRNVSITLSESL
jgi:hypothetical protein